MIKNFNSGSLKEVWKMSYPMMISFFSLSTMLFVDRIFLSRYSNKALSASVTAGTLSWAFICSIMTLAAMSEVFVSQFNGSKNYKDIGKPIWQMLWLCLISFVFFIPIGLITGSLIFPPSQNPLEYNYFLFFMLTGPFFCFHSAIAGFFIGRGFPKIIQWIAIISNIINLILDPILIFGIDGLVPSFGMMGAAYATFIGTLFQAVTAFIIFINKRHHAAYQTRNWQFDRTLFLSCLKIGLPPALFIMLELIGWTVFYIMMRGISDQHILVAGICQSILILFFFVGWGIEKGCIALGGNFIGQKKTHLLKNTLKSSIYLIGIFSVILALPLLVFPEPFINWFFDSPLAINEYSLDQNNTIIPMAETKKLIQTCLALIFFYIIIENVRWALNGLLTSAGDTLFLLIAGTLSFWTFYFVPIYLFVYIPKGSIINAYIIQIIYAVLSTAIIYYRFAKGNWKSKTLITSSPTITNKNIQEKVLDNMCAKEPTDTEENINDSSFPK